MLETGGLALHGRELHAITEQSADEPTLGIDGARLLDDQVRQHAVREDEQDRQQRQEANGFLLRELIGFLKKNGQAGTPPLLNNRERK